MKKLFTCRVVVRLLPHGQGIYYVVALTKKVSVTIKSTYGKSRRGFGAVPVQATIGGTSWQTSIFPDRRSQTYFLLLNKKVRQQEGVVAEDEVKVNLSLL